MQIYVPGQGNVDLSVYRANQAANEYDERLTFKQHPESGQWCVFISTERGLGFDNNEFPVLGFDDVPIPDEVKRRLYETDAVRHGDRIRSEMNKRNEARKAETEYRLDQQASATAEKMEHAIRKAGDAPYHKSFRKRTQK